MDQTGFLVKLTGYVNDIDDGRKGLDTDGDEHEGRVSYEKGISGALKSFQEAQKAADCQIIILAELAFMQQELQFCHEDDKDARTSLNKGIQDFTDALRCLKTVQKASAYRNLETGFPTYYTFRVGGYPKDAFHIACHSHSARLQNALRTTGVNMKEKELMKQRRANMGTAQAAYLELQRKALG
jgi:hypothetical protein